MSAPGLAARAAPRRIALLGVGTVGRALLARLQALDPPGLALAWVANSRRIAGGGALAPASALAALAQGRAHDGGAALPPDLQAGDVVVDATADAGLAAAHPAWLRQGFAVVTANKLGQGGPLLRQREIRQRVAAGGFYGDSATVGAGLPVLRSLRALHAGGDRILGLGGVLSGTLAWLFDGWDGREPFSDRVRAAVAAGFAEPDPRVDLSGEDARRKLLILARTAGLPLEAGEVRVQSLLTPVLEACAPAAMTEALASLDAPLAARAAAARAEGRVLRFVARFDADGARAGLEALAPDDPLAGGRGQDNRVAIWSCRYREHPLQIQGPGAGPEVTAAALADDLLSL